MNSLFSFLAICLVVYVTEGCWPPPPPTPTTTPPPTTTKTTPTTTSGTTTGKYECPIGGEKSKGETCVGSGNVEKIEASTDPEDCSKFWKTILAILIIFIIPR